MLLILEELGEEIPNVADIFDFINNEEVEGKQIVLNHRGRKLITSKVHSTQVL